MAACPAAALLASSEDGRQALIRLWALGTGTCLCLLNGELSLHCLQSWIAGFTCFTFTVVQLPTYSSDHLRDTQVPPCNVCERKHAAVEHCCNFGKPAMTLRSISMPSLQVSLISCMQLPASLPGASLTRHLVAKFQAAIACWDITVLSRRACGWQQIGLCCGWQQAGCGGAGCPVPSNHSCLGHLWHSCFQASG